MSEPRRPYPQQIEALVIAVDGWPIAEIARRMGIGPPAVSALLSGAYARLGITRANTPGHPLSHVRRLEARRVCRANGWWPGDESYTEPSGPVGAVLSPDDVRAIRAAPRVRGEGVRLARRYGVSVHTVSRIRNGHSWKDVT